MSTLAGLNLYVTYNVSLNVTRIYGAFIGEFSGRYSRPVFKADFKFERQICVLHFAAKTGFELLLS